MTVRAVFCALIATASAFGGATFAAAAPPPGDVHVVVSGLDNPRGLAFGPGGQLYIAEAGHGGPMALGSGPEGPLYGGLTGRLGVWANGTLSHPVTGLFSAASGSGIGAEGFVSVSSQGQALTGQFAENTSITEGAPNGIPIVDAARAELGRTVMINASAGTWSSFAATGDADFAWTAAHQSLNPDQFPDANPNTVITVGSTRYVADAGANLLARVDKSGAVSTVAYFDVPPGSPTDAVATCVANAPDGSLYVTELLGGTFAPGGARVWQVWPNGSAAVKWTGFSTIQGCGFDGSGNFYVTEFQTSGLNPSPTGNPAGDVVRISPTGVRTVFGAGSLFFPSGFAFRGGAVYVSNWSIMPADGPHGLSGQVVRIDVG
ncbi:ScyD/ScyE family protein [Microbacterium capsulatum]|uniref:ScyD/ScyE family protein n=1 Tax=Microbacterium capsulatum TaxID=3041921 RepID=A0ABU0XL39_9MICO|nr:ScyD/ScyE family protein [Microbacterium sp. ASV81]MDQ4215862.1 ScyD/ScyE family protein [Microbacterium sp. ASV81]